MGKQCIEKTQKDYPKKYSNSPKIYSPGPRSLVEINLEKKNLPKKLDNKLMAFIRIQRGGRVDPFSVGRQEHSSSTDSRDGSYCRTFPIDEITLTPRDDTHTHSFEMGQKHFESFNLR